MAIRKIYVGKSTEADDLAASLREIIRRDDRKALRKLNLFIKEIL